MFTTIDVIRGLGYEPAAPLSGEIGAVVRDTYAGVYGAPPIKTLRPKTRGPGSHCFACYPEEFRPLATRVARAILRAAHAAAAAQPSLF